MPTLTMLAEAKGAPNGHTTHTYPAGATYDLPHPLMPDDLVAAFMAMGVAVMVAEVELADDPDVADTAPSAPADTVEEPAPKPKRTRKPKA